ncbi:MAG TPA: hypothetical protein VG317_04770 [Pseudonocardiaceae bacterium]|nr:hypothetical protein [Pseudonocardiaceae bacterium]
MDRVTDESGEIKQPKDFGEWARQQAALWAKIADTYGSTSETVKKTVKELPGLIKFAGLEQDSADLIRTFGGGEQKLLLMSQIYGAMAIAYDEMVAAGGPDNAEDYAKYKETGEWLSSLMPTWDSDLPDH